MVYGSINARIKFLKDLEHNTSYEYENVTITLLNKTLTKQKITFEQVRIQSDSIDKDVLIEKDNLDKIDISQALTVICKDNIICVVK